MLAMPRAQAYGSSKAAVTHFLESMKADLTPLGLDVSVVSPGFVKTPLTDVNDFPMPMRITADQAAKEIVKGLRKRTWHIHFPKRFTFILWMLGHLPAFLRHKITAAMSRSATNTQQESK
jgi:short-subunit dehydrogenase